MSVKTDDFSVFVIFASKRRLISVTTDKTTEIELEFERLLPTKENGGTYDEKLQKNDRGNVEESR